MIFIRYNRYENKMSKAKLRKLISEMFEESQHENDLDLEDMPLSKVDMPKEDSEIFDIFSDEIADEIDDDKTDIVNRYSNNQDSYEGGYKDDESVSPGYFNEDDSEV